MGVGTQKGLEGLVVWRKSQDFSLDICRNVLLMLPDHEKYALVSQLRRSAQSIPANIAEGYGRFYYQEGIRFTYIARGSLEETFSHVQFAHEMGYLSYEIFEALTLKIDELRKVTKGFISFLKRSKRGISEPGSEYYVQPSQNSILEES
ncbi:MAG: four helix bundle protein [Anaerolineaceae bacterium]|jgi:four helix bundle protein